MRWFRVSGARAVAVGSRRESAELEGLVVSGFTELAVGALSGWLYALVKSDPRRARALGIKSGGRIRQWHLDLIALGGLTAMVGSVLPDLPGWARWPLGVGSWTNAMSFLPLALDPSIEDLAGYRAAVGVSFVLTSIGFTGAALTAIKRRRS